MSPTNGDASETNTECEDVRESRFLCVAVAPPKHMDLWEDLVLAHCLKEVKGHSYCTIQFHCHP